MNSLLDERVARSITRLHESAAKDPERRAARAGRDETGLIRMGELYLAVSPREGRLLYLLARASRAQRAFEFGASFGISTLYLAAALRDNGGVLVSTEVHPEKCAATRAVLREAGLEDAADVLEGDALETIHRVEGPIGMAFLDGWKSLYLPMLERLRPKLAAGALIAADNIDHEAAGDFARAVHGSNEFVSHTIGGIEVSCFTG